MGSFHRGLGIGCGAAIGWALGGVLVIGLVIGGCMMMVGSCAMIGSSVKSAKDSAPTTARKSPPAATPEAASKATREAAENGSRKAATEQQERSTKLVIHDAPALFAFYEQNEVEADRGCKNFTFAVKGVVEKIGKDILDHPYVALRTRNLIFCVQCMFPGSQESALVGLRPGQIVTIAGVCSGKLGNVLMRDCYFYDESAVPVKEVEALAKELMKPGEQKAPLPASQVASPAETKGPIAEPKRMQPKRAETRLWTRAGHEPIEASFHGMVGKTVLLKLADDSTLKVPLAELTEDNQEWVRARVRGKR